MKPSLNEFLTDVDAHTLTIALDSGVHRHLKFRKPGDSNHWFDIVTWPGSLAINLGREAYQPSKYARQPWQVEQEMNLMYVAATRAKRTLVDVEAQPKKKEKRAA